MSFEFATTAVPQVTRESEPNPFHEVVGELASKRDEARSFTLPHKTEADRKAAQTLLRKLGNAGKAHDVTVRKSVAVDEKKGSATVTFWVRDKINHADANSADAAAE